MALSDMLTLPLKLASETLAQQQQPQADPQDFALQVDQNNFNEKAPDFFRQAAAAIAAQAAQSAAVSAAVSAGGGGGGATEAADPEDYDHAAEAYALQDFQKQQRRQQREAAAANVPAASADGTPYYLQRPEEAAAPTGGGRGWLHKIGTGIGNVLDAPGEFARSVGTGLANVGDVVGDTGLPGSDVARRVLHVPDAAETGFLEGWKKQHGSDFSAFGAVKATNENLNTGQQWLNERLNYLTGHSIDPIINNTIGDFSPGTARWMTAAVDRIGEMIPFILLNIASGGGGAATKIPSGLNWAQRIVANTTEFMKTPVGKAFLAQGAAQLADDTQKYSNGEITGGQFIAAAGINVGANIGPDIAQGLFSEVLRSIKSPGVRAQLMRDIAEASGKAEGLGQGARGIRSAEHLAESMPSTEGAAAQKFGADANLTRQERMDRAAEQFGPKAPPLGLGIPEKGAGQGEAPLPEYKVKPREETVTETKAATKAATKTINEVAQTPTDRMSDRHTLTTEGGDRLDYRGTHINDVTVVREGKGTGTALLNHAVEAIRERNPEAIITADLNSPSGAALFAKQPGAEFFDRTGTPITAEDALKLAGEQKGPTVALHATAERVPTPLHPEETLADVHAMRAKARTSSPEELQRLARNEGLTRTHEELAKDRGEVGAAPKPVREERVPTPMRQREPRVAAGEAGALRAKGPKEPLLSERVPTSKYAELRKQNSAGATLTEDAPTHLYKIKGKEHYYGVNDTPKHWLTGKHEKELVAVMNNGGERGALATIMDEAKKKGVTLLDAWAVKNEKGEFLPRLYAKHGWEEVERMKFDPEYYPDPAVLQTIKNGWKDQGWKEGDPYPDVVYMRPKTGERDALVAEYHAAVKKSLSVGTVQKKEGWAARGRLEEKLGIDRVGHGMVSTEAADAAGIKLTAKEIAEAHLGNSEVIRAIDHKVLVEGKMKVLPAAPGSDTYRYISLENARQRAAQLGEGRREKLDLTPVQEALRSGEIDPHPTEEVLRSMEMMTRTDDPKGTLSWILNGADANDEPAIAPYIKEVERRSNLPLPESIHQDYLRELEYQQHLENAREWVRANPNKDFSESGLITPEEAKAAKFAADNVTPADRDAWKEIERADSAIKAFNNKRLDEYAKFRSETGRPIQWADNHMSKEHFLLRAAYEDATNISASRAAKALDRLDSFLRGGEDGMLRVSLYGDTIRKWFSGMGPVVERVMKAVVRLGRAFHNNELGALMRKKGSLPKFGDLVAEDVLNFGAARRWLHPEESHSQWAKHMVERIGGTEDFWHNHFDAITAHVEEKYGLLGKGKVGILANSGKEFGPEAGPRTYAELKALFDRGRKLKGANGETIDMSKWYDNFWKTMVTHFGDDAEVVTKLAAATQMNASPAAGVPQIIRGYLQWKMGEPISGMSNANIRKQMESILMGIDPKGTKIEPFYGALRYTNRVGRNSVAVDRWIIGAMGAKAEGSGMLVSKLQGNEKFIHFSQSLIKMAADEAGVDPRAFQAGVWGGFRDSWDEMLKAAGGRPQGGDNNFFENILINTMKKYDMRSPEGFVLNSLKSIEAQLTDKNTALAEVEYWQKTLKIKDENEKMYAVDYNQKIAAANFLDTGKMPEHIRMGETKDEIAKVAQQYKTAFETRVGMASDDTLRELKATPKWQKEIVDAALEQRARSNEQVRLAWKALPEKETMRLNTLGWMRIPETPVAQAGVVRALKQLEDIQTKEQFLAWAKRKGNREIVGDPMAFVGENIPTGHEYGTGKRVYKQMASSDYYQSQPFYENREQLNMQGIKDAITRRFQNPPEYARNLADTLGLHDGKVGEEASILGQCGTSAAESIF